MRNWMRFPDPATERPIFDVMFRAALHGGRNGLIGGSVLACFLAWIFWDQHTRPVAQAWFAAMALIVAVRSALLYRWSRMPDAALGAFHRRTLVAGYLTAGSLWGLAGWVFNAEAAEWARYALLTGQYTMLVMSVVALSWYLPAFVSFATPAALLIPVPWVAQSPHVGIVVALGTLFNYLAWLSFAARHAGTQADSLRMRFERQGLLDRLARHARAVEIAHQVKTRFLASASHDLRQPLHGMALVLSNARQEGGGLAPPSVLTMETMVRSLDEILDSFIEAARIDDARVDATQPRLARQPFDAQALVDQAVEEMAPLAAEARLSLRVHRHPGVVMSNAGALLRIARNLLSNALKYTASGGVLVSLRQRDSLLWLEVWDTGAGIAPQDQQRIFEPFERAGNRGAPGAGLGLAVVKQLCDTLGHRMEVHSRPGRGSVFRVCLGARLEQQVVAAPASGTADCVLLLVTDGKLRQDLIALLGLWELPWRCVDDPADWREAVQARGNRLVLVEASVAEATGLGQSMERAGLPSIWLTYAAHGAAVAQRAHAVVQVPLPLEPVVLRAAVNGTLRLEIASVLPRSPATVS